MINANNRNSALLKNVLLIAVAVVFGAVAFWLSKQHLAQKEAELLARVQNKKQLMTAVLVARSDIVAGEAIATDNMAVAEIPSNHLPLDTLTPEDFDIYSGRAALRGIPRGTPILKQYLAMTITDRFSDLLEVGQRALTISVDTLNSSEGMLKPGDHIDLFLLSNQSASVGSTNKELISLLQNITILATGRSLIVPLPEDGSGEAYGDSQYQTITVAATPQEAQKVLLAKDSGTIVTLMRNRSDKNQLPSSVLNYSSLKNNAEQIQYFTGSSAEAGALKMQMQPVTSITPPSEFPLQMLVK